MICDDSEALVAGEKAVASTNLMFLQAAMQAAIQSPVAAEHAWQSPVHGGLPS